MDEYLEEFVREGEEHVTDLNNALLTLENNPSAEAAMDQIFRTAHTLKGNFGAMGFEAASDLAHAIEDLLDEMREGTIEVTPDRMDHVFAGIDEIEACLEDIAETGDTQREVRDTIEDLRTVLDQGRSGGTAPSAGDGSIDDGDQSGDVPGALKQFDAARLSETTSPIYTAEIDLGETQMPGVDAMFVLEELEEIFAILDTRPEREAIEDGDYTDTFDVAVASDAADVQETIGEFGRVENVSVTDITDEVRSAGVGPDGLADTSGAGEAELWEEPDGTAASGSSASEGADTASEGADTGVEGADSAGEGDDMAGEGADTAGDSGSDSGSSTGSSVGDIQSVRVDVNQLDELHGLVEQLVTSRIKLRRGVDPDNRRAEEELDELDKISASLQDTVMDMRLVPMKKIVGKFPRLVRDLAREEEKQVDFEIQGDDVELDRTILTEISDPLMHLLRNAVDHGIEPPEEREAAGKDPTGQITLRAERDRDRVRIQVIDDGSGIDPDSLRRKAVEKGVRTQEEADALADDEVADLIFAPGFSTTDEVTDVSGRGVGMDVVRDTVTRLDGQVSVDSEPGEGTTITLALPVTVAIVKVLFVESGPEEYGIPIKSVDEIGRMRDVKTVDGAEVVTYGDEVYPLVRLGDALEVPGTTADGGGMLVKIREAERKVAIHCDEVRGQEEVVVKPFEGILSGIPGLSGAAVLGEGEVVTILDVGTL